MRRKVIQIAGSTKMVSLPHKWCKKYDIAKGEEINLDINEDKISISPLSGSNIEKAELDVSELERMSIRAIHAMYKRGVDELRVNFKDPNKIRDIQSAIGKEAMSFEIIEQGRDYCIIKSIAENLEEFGPILRRTFLLVVNMANDMELALSKKDFSRLKEVVFLEETNNRYTTFCRRLLNKKGASEYNKIGPIYYIVEELENIADYYKFICKWYMDFDNKKNLKLSNEALDIFKEVNFYFKEFYELFYKFDSKKINRLYEKRKLLIDKCLEQINKNTEEYCTVLLYNSWTILQHTFCMIGPYMVLKAGKIVNEN